MNRPDQRDGVVRDEYGDPQRPGRIQPVPAPDDEYDRAPGDRIREATSSRLLSRVITALRTASATMSIALAFARGLPAVRARFGAIEPRCYFSVIAWFAVLAVACAAGTR